MKKIMAGSGDAGGCTSDSECVKIFHCSSGDITSKGRCYANATGEAKKCHNTDPCNH